MKTPYETLGVASTATADEIRKAYRKLAKLHHPDVNPGKADAAETFKTIGAAHEILSDPEKRARYDRGEINAAGEEVPPTRPFYRDFHATPGHERYGTEGEFSPDDLEALLAAAMRGRGARRARGADAQYVLTVSFLDDIPGLGDTRKKRLLKEVGGVTTVKKSSLEGLKALTWLPDAVAEAIHTKARGSRR